MTFPDRLREARKNKGLTQEQLGQMVGVAKSTITGYEKGKSDPDIDKLNKIIQALEIDANYLWQDTIKMPPAVAEGELSPKKQRILNIIDQLPPEAYPRVVKILEAAFLADEE